MVVVLANPFRLGCVMCVIIQLLCRACKPRTRGIDTPLTRCVSSKKVKSAYRHGIDTAVLTHVPPRPTGLARADDTSERLFYGSLSARDRALDVAGSGTKVTLARRVRALVEFMFAPFQLQ